MDEYLLGHSGSRAGHTHEIDLAKVLHPLLGRPMLQYALDTAAAVNQEQPVVIIGQGASQIEQSFTGKARFVVQDPQLGTGHAVQQAEALLRWVAQLPLPEDDQEFISVALTIQVSIPSTRVG